ncbi:MAG: AprI/Inh family metalloprotease inhibitor [Xanthobacteraceae bacterium]
MRRRDVFRLRRASLTIAALLALTAPAPAQNATDLARDMVGQWELSTAGRDRTCVLSLKGDGAAGARALELEKGCANSLPFTKDVANWSVKGLDIVRLQDGKGDAVIDFTEVESGIFEGLRSGEGVYILQNLAAVRALTRSTDQMIGDWSVVRGNGRSICALTLTNNDAGNDSFQVFLKPRCDASVAAFAPTAWRIERGELLLMSAKREVWRFEADDNAQWRRVPDAADPFLLVRQ